MQQRPVFPAGTSEAEHGSGHHVKILCKILATHAGMADPHDTIRPYHLRRRLLAGRSGQIVIHHGAERSIKRSLNPVSGCLTQSGTNAANGGHHTFTNRTIGGSESSCHLHFIRNHIRNRSTMYRTNGEDRGVQCIRVARQLLIQRCHQTGCRQQRVRGMLRASSMSTPSVHRQSDLVHMGGQYAIAHTDFACRQGGINMQSQNPPHILQCAVFNHPPGTLGNLLRRLEQQSHARHRHRRFGKPLLQLHHHLGHRQRNCGVHVMPTGMSLAGTGR
ncbi:hypothetical protein LBMAG46_18230 [Planctomycetia bacterium]|nr:hypothetical protein LBMAG46_18230 [Planctomycetia bacterium]